MRDEEIDVILTKAAQAPYDLKPETLQRVAASMKPSFEPVRHPVRPLPPTWMMAGGIVLVCGCVSLLGAARAGFLGIAKMNPTERHQRATKPFRAINE